MTMTHTQLTSLTEMASAALVAIERLDAGRPQEEIFAWLRDIVDQNKVVAFGVTVLLPTRGET